MEVRILLLFLFICLESRASTTLYYVDSGRTASGTGTAASPWKVINDIDWTAMSNSLATGPVTLYFSSRGSWNPPNQVLTPKTYGNSTVNIMSYIADEQFNTNATGTAVWAAETDNTHRAILTGGANIAAPFSGPDGYGLTWVVLKGFYVDHPLFSGIQMITKTSPATNVHDIYITNCVIDSPVANIGIAFSENSAGCSNWVISGCTISNSPGEGIYVGKYDYLTDLITGVVVESNLVVNCGTGAPPGSGATQGEIDIKPPCYGAVIRYNTQFRTAHGLGGTTCGTVIGSDACQIYGNIFYNSQSDSNGGWGNGIFVSSDGDGVGTGKRINSCLIYNNVVHDANNCGIRFSATTSTSSANISGVKIWNNTVVGNAINGILCQTAAGRTLTVDEVYNNIIAGNTNSDISIDAGTTLTLCDYNLYYRASGNSWTVNSVSKTFAQWQALGFDSHGVNGSDPQFVGGLDYRLKSSSPAVDVGKTLASFSADINKVPRPQGAAWDIGAYEFVPPYTTITTLNVGVIIQK